MAIDKWDYDGINHLPAGAGFRNHPPFLGVSFWACHMDMLGVSMAVSMPRNWGGKGGY